MEDFMATVPPRPADTGGIWRQLLPNLFCASPNFVVLRKVCFKHIIITKIFPLKVYVTTQTLKLGYGSGSAKTVSTIRIFCFEGHSASSSRII